MSAPNEQSDEVFCVWCGRNQDNCECDWLDEEDDSDVEDDE